jgi:hypothetical protein
MTELYEIAEQAKKEVKDVCFSYTRSWILFKVNEYLKEQGYTFHQRIQIKDEFKRDYLKE